MTIYLRELTRTDLPQILSWRQDRELNAFLGSPFYHTAIEGETAWFEQYLNNRANQIRLAICTIHDHRHIGNIYLLNLDWRQRQGELSLFIGEKQARNQGYGHQATMQLIQHAFEDLNLHRLELQVLASNQRAIALYEKCGFQREGTRRQALFKQGQFQDMHIYGLLKQEFQASP